MLRARRTRSSEPVRARRCNRKLRRRQQRLRDRMTRHPQRDGGPTRRDFLRHARRLLDNHRERPRPEPRRQRLKHRRQRPRQRPRHREVADVNDERVPSRPFLRGKDFTDSIRIKRVGAEAIHRLGWKRDKSARAQNRGSARHGGRTGWNNSLHAPQCRTAQSVSEGVSGGCTV